jgi:hypothetical protein
MMPSSFRELQGASMCVRTSATAIFLSSCLFVYLLCAEALLPLFLSHESVGFHNVRLQARKGPRFPELDPMCRAVYLCRQVTDGDTASWPCNEDEHPPPELFDGPLQIGIMGGTALITMYWPETPGGPVRSGRVWQVVLRNDHPAVAVPYGLRDWYPGHSVWPPFPRRFPRRPRTARTHP